MERISNKSVTIRKPRKCFGCCRQIKKGDRAYVQTNSDDGRIYSLTLCSDCQKKVEEMRYDDEFSEGELKDI